MTATTDAPSSTSRAPPRSSWRSSTSWANGSAPPIDSTKDAHDIYRLLVATETGDLAAALQRLRNNEVAHEATTQALIYLAQLFASAKALGATMAGRAEEGIGQPDTVSASVRFLAQDLLSAAGRSAGVGRESAGLTA